MTDALEQSVAGERATQEANRLGEIVDQVNAAYEACESPAELVWAVTQVLGDHAEHGTDINAAERDRLAMLIRELRLIAATQAVIDAALKHMAPSVASDIARNYAAGQPWNRAPSLRELRNHAMNLLQHRVRHFGTEVRALADCADAMARAWRSTR